MNNLFLYWPSVLLYVVCISASVLFAAMAQIYCREEALGGIPGRGRARLPNRFWWFFSMLVPLLLSSLRVDMGTDYANYQYLYVELNKIQSFPQFVGDFNLSEPAFILLNMFVKAGFNDPQMVFVLSAALTLLPFYAAMKEYSDKCSLTLMVLGFLCLLYPQSMNIIRQMIAVSFIFLAVKFMFVKKYGRMLLLILLAGSFHVTSFLVLPFLFLHEGKRGQRMAVLILFIVAVVLLIVAMYAPSLIAGIPLLGMLTGQSGQGSIGIGLLAMRMPLLLPPLIFRRRLIAHDSRNRFWLILLVFELVFSYYGYLNDVFNRIALYFALSWIVLLPSLVRSMPGRDLQRLMGAYVVAVFVILWFSKIVINNYGETIPYYSIFAAIG